MRISTTSKAQTGLVLLEAQRQRQLMSFDILFEKNFSNVSMSDHVQGDDWSLQIDYARQQANADQQYEPETDPA